MRKTSIRRKKHNKEKIKDMEGACKPTMSKVPSVSQDLDDEVNQEVLSENFEACCTLQNSPGRMAPLHRRKNRPVSCHVSDSDPNWQANCKTVRERNEVLFMNELMADVHFLVGTPSNEQRIPAHTYVLATGSSVFFAMFFGGLADPKMNNEIRIPDVEPSAFRNLLRYLYCDMIEPEDDTVLATLYAAKKYIVPHLARECVAFLESRLCAKNACLLLSQSRLFEEHELMQRCWEVIDAQAEVALMSEGFTEIDFNTLEIILKRETLNAPEVVIFNSALLWAGAECARREIKATPENRRDVLGQAIYLLRIPTMTLDSFANTVPQSRVLTLGETNDLFLYFTAQDKPKVPFVSHPRQGLKAQKCHRFQSCAFRSNQWRYRGRCDSIQFCVDHRIFITGFGIYGSSNGPSEYKIRIELKCQRTGKILGQKSTSFLSDGSPTCFPVNFNSPIHISPDTYYIASAVLDGQELSYFGQEGMGEVQIGSTTFQFQCSSDSTNGTGVQGGQIPELIFYR